MASIRKGNCHPSTSKTTFMRVGWTLLIVCFCHGAQAQFQQHVAINRITPQQPPANKPDEATMPRTFNIAAKIMAHNVKALFAKTTARPKKNNLPVAEALLLEAERVNEE